MTLEEFKKQVLTGIEQMPYNWRKGQKVFNYIDKEYSVARLVQYEKGIDCFYDNGLIDKFIEESYNILKSSHVL